MKRFLKITGILVLFFAVIGYVVLRDVFFDFFDPFGGGRATLDALIPKDADVVLRRKDLAKDFDPFPMPRFFNSLRLKDQWDSLVRTRFWRDLEPTLGIEPLYAQLEEIPRQLEPLDLLQDFAGKEALIVGRFRKDSTLAWSAVVRGSNRAKFVIEAVKIGLLRKFSKVPLEEYAEQDGVRSITVDGVRWHLARSEDAILVGNDFDLVHEMRQLAEGGALGIDDSPQYRGAILSPSGWPDDWRPIDFAFDVGEWCKQAHLTWPPRRNGDDMLLKFLRELLVPDRFGQAMGRIGLGDQRIELQLSASADRGALASAAGGLLDGTTADLANIHSFCGAVFPEKTALCGGVRLGIKAFLRRLESLNDPDVREVINQFVTSVKLQGEEFRPKSTVELLDAFADCVTDELYFALEPDEPYHVPGAPDNEMVFPNPRWGSRLALIFPAADPGRASQFIERIVAGLRTRVDAVPNIWKWSWKEQGVEFRELEPVDSDLPHFSIGLVELQKRPCVVLTTTGAFLSDIVAQKFRVDAGGESGLQSTVEFRQAISGVTGVGQGFLFVTASNLQRILSDLCAVWAEDATRPDWVTIRGEVERKFIAQKFPGDVGKPITETIRKKVEKEVDSEIDSREATWKETTLPRKVEELRNDLGALEMARWATFSMRVAERDLELKLRIATPATFVFGE